MIFRISDNSELIIVLSNKQWSSSVNVFQWRIYIVKFWTLVPNPWESKFFKFHAVFGKIWQNCMLAPPPESWRPLLGEILDPPLYLNTYCAPVTAARKLFVWSWCNIRPIRTCLEVFRILKAEAGSYSGSVLKLVCKAIQNK